MPVRFHPHARERMLERGAAEDEVRQTIEDGEQVPARHGRISFRRNFPFAGVWRGRQYQWKQVGAVSVQDGDDWLVITVITRYY